MAYEGIVSQVRVSLVIAGRVLNCGLGQLKHHKSSPLPCLHTLLTPTGLSMLKSAPLKHAFPICPPRSAPSPSSLLASIRSLLASGALSGPEWATAADWRPQIRKAFARYHAMVKQAAEALVSDPTFATEYTIFLESISQPLQLLALISDDFEHEFGAGACKGLLGVGDVGGQNLIQIMDFCAARRPSELLKRVKVRVKEKREREDREKEVNLLRARVDALRAEADQLRSSLGDGADEHERAHRIDLVSRESEQLDADIRAREQREKDRDDEVRRSVERAKALVAAESRLPPAPAPTTAAFIQGSSKDLLRLRPDNDPFASTAPRAVSPSPASAKGKGRALHPLNGAVRLPCCFSCERTLTLPLPVPSTLSLPVSAATAADSRPRHATIVPSACVRRVVLRDLRVRDAREHDGPDPRQALARAPALLAPSRRRAPASAVQEADSRRPRAREEEEAHQVEAEAAGRRPPAAGGAPASAGQAANDDGRREARTVPAAVEVQAPAVLSSRPVHGRRAEPLYLARARRAPVRDLPRRVQVCVPLSSSE